MDDGPVAFEPREPAYDPAIGSRGAFNLPAGPCGMGEGKGDQGRKQDKAPQQQPVGVKAQAYRRQKKEGLQEYTISTDSG